MRFTPVLLSLVVASAATAFASNVGKRFPSEKTVIVDQVTGLPVTVLTTSPANDSKNYQTHPQWTFDGKWVIFRSDRSAAADASRDMRNQAFAVNTITGVIVQLTDSPNATGSLNISRKKNLLYTMRGGPWFSARLPDGAEPPAMKEPPPRQLIEINLDVLLADSEAGTMKEPAAYERIVATLPAELRDSGGFALDADETKAYWGVAWGPVPTPIPPRNAPLAEGAAGARSGETPEARARRELDARNGVGAPRNMPIDREAQRARFEAQGKGPGGIRSIDLQTGEIKTVIDVDMRMGHVQTNYWAPGEIMYCHETGGDAPQRMWFVRSDGTDNRPLYVETPDEWITHEVFIDADHILFNVMGHLAYLHTKPTGVFELNIRTNEVRVLGQGKGQGFWHCNGTSDGRWAVSDDFDGNVTLINRQTGEMTVLTTGHVMRPDHTHPTFFTDNRQILIQSGLLSGGKSLDLMVITIPDWLQNP
jgi:oligogalacturonide lyase